MPQWMSTLRFNHLFVCEDLMRGFYLDMSFVLRVIISFSTKEYMANCLRVSKQKTWDAFISPAFHPGGLGLADLFRLI